MKKLIISLFLVCISVIGFGQATPTANIRIGNATTAFGVNIPVGYTVYDVNANKFFVCKTAAVSTLTLTTGAANFQEILSTAVASITSGLGITVTGTATVPIVAVDTTNASILSRQRAANTYQAKGSYQTTTLNSGKILVGNGSNVATAVDMSGEATIANTGAVTVANSAVIGKVLTGYTSGAGTVAATDNILQAIQKLNGNQATTAAALKTYKVEETEIANGDSATAGHYYFTLANTPIAGTITVQVNGSAIKSTTQYTVVATNKIRIGFSLSQFDKLLISYSY